METDYVNEDCLMVAKIRERLALNTQRPHRFRLGMFYLKKLNEVECKEKYRVEVSNRFAALGVLVTKREIISSLERIKENIFFSVKECICKI
jgi:hypothetical protein